MNRARGDDQRSKRRRPRHSLQHLTLHTVKHKRVYLHVSFFEKQLCKELGGIWDPTERRWYVAPECFEAIDTWQQAPNPHPVPRQPEPAPPRYQRPRVLSKPITVDRFGNVLTDADLSA